MVDCPVLQVSVLGALAITRDKRPVTGFASAKVQALLCYLALTARPHSRDTLIGLLWSEISDADARTSLRQALTNLRRLVGDHLSIDRETVAFDRSSSYSLDAEQFSRTGDWRLEIGDWTPALISNLQSAIELYRGDLLEGFFVRDAPEFEEWLLTQRERFRQQALQVFHTLVAYHLARHEYARGIDYATRLLALDAWREEAHRQLMLLYARNGQRGAALAQYEICRRVLTEKIAVEPSAETVALYERIRATDTTKTNLPPQATTFVGREMELAQIDSFLMKPECRLITLVGQGGIGKTRLAIHAAAKQAGAFLNGIHFVPLSAVTSPELIPSTIADALKISLSGKSPPRTQVLEFLRDKEMLLVLDNFEQLIAGAKLLADILNAAHDVKMIVTSRERLNLQSEWIVQVDGLPTPDFRIQNSEFRSADNSQFASVQLFLQSAGRVHARLAPNDDEMASIVRICQLVHGIPLGIELAAAWVTSQSCDEIAREIERSLDFLATTQYDVPERQRSLRAAFDHSWNLLDAEEQRVLRALSVFRGGFTREAGERVTGALLMQLGALIDKSLLRRDAIGRYEMHPVVQQFAQAKLEPSEKQTETRRQHVQYFLSLAEQAAPALTGKQQAEWLNRLTVEHDNLRAVLSWTLESRDTETSLRLAGAIWRFWFMRGYWSEGRHWLEMGLEQDGDVLPAVKAKALEGSGVLASNQGDHARASASYEQALALRRTLDDKGGIAPVLNSMGLLAQRQGDFARAVMLYEESLGLKRALGDQWGIAATVCNLGWVNQQRGEYTQAQTFLEESLGTYRELGDRRSTTFPLTNLGIVAGCLGDYPRAATYFAESLVVLRELGDQRGIAMACINLGEASRRQDDAPRAIALFEEALRLARELQDRWMVAHALGNLGDVAQVQADYQKAAEFYKQGLELRREIGDKEGIARCLEGLAQVALAQNQPARAARLFASAEALREAIHAPLEPEHQSRHERDCASVRAHIGDAAYTAAWTEGRALSLEQIVAYALAQ